MCRHLGKLWRVRKHDTEDVEGVVHIMLAELRNVRVARGDTGKVGFSCS
jgi:hypothetical protein